VRTWRPARGTLKSALPGTAANDHRADLDCRAPLERWWSASLTALPACSVGRHIFDEIVNLFYLEFGISAPPGWSEAWPHGFEAPRSRAKVASSIF
jgi:hypothetical protein